MLLSQLFQSLGDVRAIHFHDLDISGVSADSRRTSQGDVFVAVRGTAIDGHRFVPDALSRGAHAVVLEREDCLPRPVPGCVVRDTRPAMARLAHAFYELPASKMVPVGVTGTKGKTTTTLLVAEILRAAGMRPGVVGTLGYSFGGSFLPIGQTTPGPLDLARILSLMVGANCRSMAMEVSSHALDQDRVEGIEYEAAIFTNLTRDHLDYHKNFENYLSAKSKLFQNLSSGSVAVLNRDVPESAKIAPLTSARIVWYGFQPSANVVGRIERMTLGGTLFNLSFDGGRYQVSSALVGRHNVSNMLAAAAAAHGLGIDPGTIVRGLENLRAIPGRLEPIPNSERIHVLVDYAHTDDSLEKVLSTVRSLFQGRILLVFGCGGNRDTTKRAPMGRVAARFADRFWITSDNPRREDPGAIARMVAAGVTPGAKYKILLAREEAIYEAVREAREGDVVVIAGKGHEDSQDVDGRMIPFDDRVVARMAIARRKRKP